MRKLHDFQKTWTATQCIVTGLWKIQYSMGIGSLVITHYKQRPCIFLWSFKKPQPSPTDEERNQCPLHVQQQKFLLILQMQSWYWFWIIISHQQKTEFSDFRWQKTSCAEINLSLCHAFYWDTEIHLQLILVILSFHLSHLSVFLWFLARQL